MPESPWPEPKPMPLSMIVKSIESAADWWMTDNPRDTDWRTELELRDSGRDCINGLKADHDDLAAFMRYVEALESEMRVFLDHVAPTLEAQIFPVLDTDIEEG